MPSRLTAFLAFLPWKVVGSAIFSHPSFSHEKKPSKIQLFPEVAVATARHVQLEIPLKVDAGGRLSISHSIYSLKEVSKSKKSTGTTNKNNQQRSCHPSNWFQNFWQKKGKLSMLPFLARFPSMKCIQGWL